MIVIVEGPDRCGKSTQIANIHKEIANTRKAFPLNIHCANFGIKDKELSASFSEMYYHKLLKDVVKLSQSVYDVILDRSHIGEAVYSPLYRDSDGDYVFKLEQRVFNLRDLDHIYLITLIDDPKKLIERDDGLSFTVDLDKKEKEINLFTLAHHKSNIQKKLLINNNFAGGPDEVWALIKNFVFGDN